MAIPVRLATAAVVTIVFHPSDFMWVFLPD
jgi:hypothetical protein